MGQRDLEAAIGEYPTPDFVLRLKIRAFAVALALIVRPLGYTLLHPIAERLKYKELHTDFHIRAYTPFQARLGLSLLNKLERFSQKRLANGRFLQDAFSNIDGIRLPQVLETGAPAYNQFPVLLPDEQTRSAVHRAILETGLEATRLYPDPVHRWAGWARLSRFVGMSRDKSRLGKLRVRATLAG